jgi:hypothetical protein
LFAGCGVPDADSLSFVNPTCNHLSIGTEGDAIDIRGEIPGNIYPEQFLPFYFVSGGSIPELDGIVPVARER